MRALATVALLLVACETPPLTIRFMLTDGDSQQCISENTGNPTTNCSDISMICEGVLSIRIVPPNEPEVPYVSVCQLLKPTTSQPNLCSIAGVDLPLPKAPIPEQVLEVQMAVFERSTVGVDIDGNLVCPIVQFGVNGLPVMDVDCSNAGAGECTGRPAVGGRAFYHPGDTETLIKLGCTELELLRGEKCTDVNRTEVIATVNEFEYPGSVDPGTANHLFVSIGEPTPGTMGNYVLDISRLHGLARDQNATGLPTWNSVFTDLGLTKTYCIEVREDAPMATSTLTCREVTDPDKIDGVGTLLKPGTLSMVLKAAGLTAFPTNGIVIGIMLKPSFQPVVGEKVQLNCPPDMTGCTANVKYLSEDKLSLTNDFTHSTGIFVSTDAPYGSTFNRLGQVGTVFGGIVENKVTIVVIQETAIGGM